MAQLSNKEKRHLYYLKNIHKWKGVYHDKWIGGWWSEKEFGGKRAAVLVRDGGKCVVCRSTKTLTVDHINRDGTDNRMANLQTLCRPCHGRKDGPSRSYVGQMHGPDGKFVSKGKP